MESPALRTGARSDRPGVVLASARPRWVHPRFRKLPPPVIVIGMHRSGTSLVAGILARLGVYLGPKVRLPDRGAEAEKQVLLRAGYAEAEEFVYLNDDLLRAGGATWDRVEPFLARLEERPFAAARVARLQRATAGSLRWDYLAAMPRQYSGAWGWKDPRTTLTLPLWLALFPEARVVYVRRKTAAAAASLHRRALEPPPPAGPPLPPKERVRWWIRHPGEAGVRLARKLKLAPPSPPVEDPCRDRGYCEALCRQYHEAAERHLSVAVDPAELWYEEFLAKPVEAVSQLAEQVGLPVSEAEIRFAAALVGKR